MKYANLISQIAEAAGIRVDAAESIFFARELEHVRAQAFEFEYPELMGRSFVGVNREASNADEKFTYTVYDHVGSAEVSSGYATTGPRVDTSGRQESVRFFPMKNSYGWSIQEMRASLKERKRLDQRRANAAREAMERKIDNLILTGESSLGILGLFNQTTNLTYTVPAGAGGLTTWASKTPDEILADMNGIATAIVTNSNDVEHPSRLLLPLAHLELISSVRLGDGSDTTILKHFLANSRHIQRVDSHYALATAGSGSTARMVAYDPRTDRLEAPISQEFEQLPPQYQGYEVLTHCHARAAGVVLYRPKSMAYGDNI